MGLSAKEEQELLMLLEIEQTENSKNNYYDYVMHTHNGQYKPSRHGKLICDTLQGAIDKKKAGHKGHQYYMFFMPPRHGKSMTISETFPSYFLGNFPDGRVIISSYGESLAKRFGRFNRQKITEHGMDLFDIELAADSKSVTEWNIGDHRGGVLSVGIGGGITGQGADLMIIDDPVKNQQEADSETYRERVWQEWQSTLSTRLHPNSIVVIILTRWHEDDIAGRLLNPEYGEVKDWNIVSLPATAEEEDDPMGRAIGEPLWPEHGFDETWAESQKQTVGARTWAALYQQRPSPAEGNMLKREWWRYYDKPPLQFGSLIQSWDCTFKDGDNSDYVVGQVWGKVGPNMYLVDQVRARMDFPTTVQAIRNMSAKWPAAHLKLIEDKANGSAIIQTLQRELVGVYGINPEGGKVARANAVSFAIETGNVLIPKCEAWTHDFVEECASFPNGKHDDQVDAMTQALNRFIYHSGDIPAKEPEPLPFALRSNEEIQPQEGYGW